MTKWLHRWFQQWRQPCQPRQVLRARELDRAVRCVALGRPTLVSPAAMLHEMLPRVTSVTARWEDDEGRAVHAGSSPAA